MNLRYESTYIQTRGGFLGCLEILSDLIIVCYFNIRNKKIRRREVQKTKCTKLTLSALQCVTKKCVSVKCVPFRVVKYSFTMHCCSAVLQCIVSV